MFWVRGQLTLKLTLFHSAGRIPIRKTCNVLHDDGLFSAEKYPHLMVSPPKTTNTHHHQNASESIGKVRKFVQV